MYGGTVVALPQACSTWMLMLLSALTAAFWQPLQTASSNLSCTHLQQPVSLTWCTETCVCLWQLLSVQPRSLTHAVSFNRLLQETKLLSDCVLPRSWIQTSFNFRCVQIHYVSAQKMKMYMEMYFSEKEKMRGEEEESEEDEASHNYLLWLLSVEAAADQPASLTSHHSSEHRGAAWSVYTSVCHTHLHWSQLRRCDAHTHTCIYTQVAGQVQCAALSCHPPLADLLFSRSSERLLLMNYAAAGPCNKLQADSTPCVWLKI